MEHAGIAVAAPAATYDIGGLRLSSGSNGFAQAIANAYSSRQRPHCLCVLEGVEMYVARLGDGYIVKRMPDTGSHHVPDCPSYEPPAEFSGLGQVLGSAITEDPATGETTLKLDFSLSKIAGRSMVPAAGGDSESVASSGTRLSLRGLLHYLWDQAELTHWRPIFAGKRTWGTVRKHLLMAADNKVAIGDSLISRLYIPEVFYVEQRDSISIRRTAQWSKAISVPGKPQHLMLLIAEVKEIVPARYGFKAILKHVPDQAFAIDEPLYRRLGRRFELELALWGASDDIHMVLAATFGVGNSGIPTIHEMCLMPVTRQWLPVADGFERQLVDRLVNDERSFVKGLQYNASRRNQIAAATLTDCEGSAPILFIRQPGHRVERAPVGAEGIAGSTWFWDHASGTIPTLPLQRERKAQAT